MPHDQQVMSRTLSNEECDTVSGGIGWFAAIAIWAGAAAIGSGLAVLTKSEEALVPKIDLPPSPELPQ